MSTESRAKTLRASNGMPPLADHLEVGGVVVGVDPGSATGIVAVRMPATLLWNDAHWLGSRVLAPSQRKGLFGPSKDAEYGARIGLALADFVEPGAHIALEEPRDATVRWRGYTRQRTETAFRLGCYYGLAAAGALQAGAREVVSYPVTTDRVAAGWMGGRGREAVFAETDALARVLRVPPETLEQWSEHERMALGVVAHHVRVVTAYRRLARLAKVAGAGAR